MKIEVYDDNAETPKYVIDSPDLEVWYMQTAEGDVGANFQAVFGVIEKRLPGERRVADDLWTAVVRAMRNG